MFKIRNSTDPIVIKEQYHYRTNSSSVPVTASRLSKKESSAQKLAEARRNAIAQTQARTKASSARASPVSRRVSSPRVSSAQKLAEARRNAIAQTQTRSINAALRVTTPC